MSVFLGVSGASRNACAAVSVNGTIRAACEEERLARIRAIGITARGFPRDAVAEVLALAGCAPRDVGSYVVAERQVRLPQHLPAIVLDHHHAHAATAFLTSPFERAAVLVCDSHRDRELSVWMGEGASVTDQQWRWHGSGFATLYSECASLFDGARHPAASLEALAHLGSGDRLEQLQGMFRYVDGGLVVEPGYRARLHEMIEHERSAGRLPVETAGAIQRRIGELLLELLADIRTGSDVATLCLGGGLFYNTYLTTLIRRSGTFKDVFVPINPGNAGLAVGATLMLAETPRRRSAASPVSPFLGPEYDAETIKATLDSCKLLYSFVSDSEAIDIAVDALKTGRLVGWFQGRMEWGHRALGHRSILASPQSPYVLDNLNLFLRKRERWRSFGVSVCAGTVGELFCGPPSSPFMEYEYAPRDSDRLRYIMPDGATSIRVQTIAQGFDPFYTLHKRFEQATGIGVLVHTSFNAFHEPIVCSPRDAIRVFYGTGLDVLVLGQFILRK